VDYLNTKFVKVVSTQNILCINTLRMIKKTKMFLVFHFELYVANKYANTRVANVSTTAISKKRYECIPVLDSPKISLNWQR
jgi:hypothetical protein